MMWGGAARGGGGPVRRMRARNEVLEEAANLVWTMTADDEVKSSLLAPLWPFLFSGCLLLLICIVSSRAHSHI